MTTAPPKAPQERPEPLTPRSCDLRGLNYMPLFGGHLYGSDFNAAATDAEFRAGLALYWSAWWQVPAGSLPNNDKALCVLAGLGRDVDAWQALRAGALHGFIECSDGRLYHPFLCEQARVAWDARVASRERKRQWREKKSKKERGQDGPVPGTSRSKERGQDGPVPSEAKRRDVADLKVSDVASLSDAPARPSDGTTGHGAGRQVPPSREPMPASVADTPKTATKQPHRDEDGSGARADAQRLPTVLEEYEPMAIRLGLGTFAEAAGKGMSLGEYASAALRARNKQRGSPARGCD